MWIVENQDVTDDPKSGRQLCFKVLVLFEVAWSEEEIGAALEKWGEAAGSLGGARGDKFLKLLGGAKHGATAKKRKADSKGEDDLERQYESARRRGGAWNRQGLG